MAHDGFSDAFIVVLMQYVFMVEQVLIIGWAF